MLSDPAAASALGLRCLKTHPELLRPEFCLRQTGVVGATYRTPGAAVAAFRRRQQRDYAVGRTALVDGWLLARSEIALFSLLALTDPESAS